MSPPDKPSNDSAPPAAKLPRSRGWRLTPAERDLIGAFLAYHRAGHARALGSARTMQVEARSQQDAQAESWTAQTASFHANAVSAIDRLLGAVAEKQRYPRPGEPL